MISSIPPDVTHEVTHEVTQEVTDLRPDGEPYKPRHMAQITTRKRCNEKCPLFYECPLMVIAIQAPVRERVCLMRIMGPGIRRRFVKMFGGGEDGLIEEMKKILFIYSQDIERMPPARQAEYFEMLLKMFKAIYGERRVQIKEPKPISIQLREVNGRFVSKELFIDRNVNTVIPQHIKDEARERLEDINPENDPESLINSPVVESFVGFHPGKGAIIKGEAEDSITEAEFIEVRHD